MLVSTVLGNSQGPQNVERVIVQDFTFFVCLEKINKATNIRKSYVLNKSFYDEKITFIIVDVAHRSVGNGSWYECQECRWSRDLVYFS